MENKITCEECGEQFHNLGTHIKTHGISRKEYSAKHPGAQFTSAIFNQKQRNRMLEQYNRTDIDYKSIAGKRHFDFILNKPLKSLLQRDYGSAKLCLKNKLWKPAIILYGSIIEAILIEVTKEKYFDSAIERAFESKTISEKEYHKIHMIRDLRNFVHLHKELKEKEEINDYWAKTFSDISESIIRKLQGKNIIP